jgi:hypothetical protein
MFQRGGGGVEGGQTKLNKAQGYLDKISKNWTSCYSGTFALFSFFLNFF